MFLNLKVTIQNIFFGTLATAFLGSCASAPPKKPISISEQIVLDSHKSQDLLQEFKHRVVTIPEPDIQGYLNHLTENLAKQEKGFEARSVEVRVHQDNSPGQKRLFSFPGTTIFIPNSFLHSVEFEIELAGAVAFELSKVILRDLAKRLDQGTGTPVLFGEASVFDLERDERKAAIAKATALLYAAKFDTRGLASFFQRYSGYVSGGLHSDSDLEKKEVEFNIREAQRARMQYPPLRDPVVRSNGFIMMKRRIKK